METDYLTWVQASHFVHECEQRGTFIYGVERFLFEDGAHVPDLDGIADFSTLPLDKVVESISSAENFLKLFGDSSRERFKIVY